MQAQSDHFSIPHPSAKVLLSVEEAALMMSVGRTFMYTLLRSNEIRSVKVGRHRRIPLVALYEYVERLAAIAS